MKTNDYHVARPHVEKCMLGVFNGITAKIVLCHKDGRDYVAGTTAAHWLQISCSNILCDGALRINMKSLLEKCPKIPQSELVPQLKRKKVAELRHPAKVKRQASKKKAVKKSKKRGARK